MIDLSCLPPLLSTLVGFKAEHYKNFDEDPELEYTGTFSWYRVGGDGKLTLAIRMHEKLEYSFGLAPQDVDYIEEDEKGFHIYLIDGSAFFVYRDVFYQREETSATVPAVDLEGIAV